MSKGVTNTQQCDIYQLSLVLFELLFSPVKNKLAISDKDYKLIIQKFIDEDNVISKKIPTNFINGSLPDELDMVSLIKFLHKNYVLLFFK